MNKVVAIIAIAVVLGGGWYLLKKTNSPLPQTIESGLESQGTSSESLSEESGSETSATTGDLKEFSVTGANFSFSPKTITVKKGDTVKINFTNSVGFHDLVIDEFNVRTPQINAGQTASITFVADKAGSFEYYCSVGTHRQMGMWGTIVVN